MDKRNRIWELLGKKAAGELEENEVQELEELLQEQGDKQGLHYMMNVMDHFWESIQEAPESEKLLESAGHYKKNAMNGILSADYLHEAKENYTLKRRKVWLWAAAAAIFVLGGWFIYRSFNLSKSEMNIVATRSGSKTKVILPDGTEVWLNADSKLTYPNDFQHISQRDVTLSGEAYFKVKHDPDHPFVIHTKYLSIKDIGTEFNLKAYPGEEESEAMLVKGAIAVSLRNDPGKNIVLKPGEKVMYYASEECMKMQSDHAKEEKHKKLQPLHTPDMLEVTKVKPVVVAAGDSVVAETAWMNNQLVFNGEKFFELAHRLSRWYDVDIKIKNKQVADYSFTGIFEGETLEQALKELQMIRPFSFSISKDKIIISSVPKQ